MIESVDVIFAELGESVDRARRRSELTVLAGIGEVGDRGLRTNENQLSKFLELLDALFEESWAYFMAGQYPKALGNIHTIESPYFPSRQSSASLAQSGPCSTNSIG